MSRSATDFAAVLAALYRHRVRFLLVGGVAAVIEGAPLATFDVDIVPDRGDRNIDRLMTALAELEAHYRERPDLRPTADALAGSGHHLLLTRHGPLDVLGSIGRGRTYGDLSPRSRRRVVGGTPVRVLQLEAQIAVKEELNFAKDRAALPLLRAALEQRRQRRR